MRWLGGMTAIVLVLAGGLVGGGFLLPTTLEVDASTVIHRPRATVHALAANLGAAKEFLPLSEHDPAAEFSLQGDGEAQVLRWSSRVARIGSGSMAIEAETPMESVTYRVRPSLGQPALMRIEIRPERQGDDAGEAGLEASAASVVTTWRFASKCDPHWRELPCRFVNLLAAPMVRADLERGLRRLARLAEETPPADFEGLIVTPAVAEARAFAFVERRADEQPGRTEEALSAAIGQVRAFLTAAALQPAGPPVSVATEWTPQAYAFQAGVPFSGPMPLASDQVKVGRTPGGPALKVVHVGPYSSRAETYARFEAYLIAHRLRVVGPAWEVLPQGVLDTAGSGPLEIWRRVDGQGDAS